MAATYTNLPVHIPTMIRTIVDEVSDNLSTESTLDIANVHFYCETWDVLRQRLIEDGKVESLKNTRYPFIALIRGFDEKYKKDSDYVESSLTLVIVTRSSPNMKSEDRESTNYIPILYPIYAEFISVLNNTRYSMTRNRDYPTHTKHDNLNLGQETPQGNIANRLPDFVDAVVIEGLQVMFDVETCINVAQVSPKTVLYKNIVNRIDITLVDNNLRIFLTNVTYLQLLPSEYTCVYSVYRSHDPSGDIEFITEGGVYILTVTGIADGSYYGYVQGDDTNTISKLYFFYVIRNGAVIHYTVNNSMELDNFNVSGYDADYPYDITTSMEASSSMITYRGFAVNGGSAIYDHDYIPSVSELTELVYSHKATLNTYADVQYITNINTGYESILQLESIAYYKIN